MSSPRKIAVYNQKGGAGKSTTAANLAVALASKPLQRRVLALDLDKQGNLSLMLGHNPAAAPGNMTDVFEGRPLGECTVAVSDGLDLVVGDDGLANVEFNLQSARRREEILARQLQDELDGYDYVLIDCPPNQGLLAVNACVLADEVLVPVRMNDPNAVNGLGDLIVFLEDLADAAWPRPISSVLRLDVDRRLDIYAALNEALESMELPIAEQEISHRTAVSKAIAQGVPIAAAQPNRGAGWEYRCFAHELDAITVAS